MENKPKKKFYKKWWFWVLALFIVIGMVSGGDDEEKSADNTKPTTTQEQKEEPKKEQFDFTNAEVTKENVTKAITDIVGKDKLKSVEVTVKDSKTIVDIVYNPDEVWDEKALVKNNAMTATNTMEVLFKNAKVDKVWVWTETEMQDAKGNTAAENVVNVALTKENAKDINWENFKTKVAGDYKALFNIADSKFIHPGIAQNLK